MSGSFFCAETLDDLLHEVTVQVLAEGIEIKPTRGRAKELSGVMLELTNPLARISRTESRGKLFSCLGELMWYLAKSNDRDFIEYYIRDYGDPADGDEIFGGYGPRLFDWNGINQFRSVRDRLRDNPDSRRAVIQLFAASDIKETPHNVPCTCTLQFMIRNDRLNLVTHMRSNDIYLGLPHDVFCFTMLQEIMARDLGLELGTYKHMVGSLHLYLKDVPDMKDFLREGWQPTSALMPSMPTGNPWPSIKTVLDAERAVRLDENMGAVSVAVLHPYWADLVRLLRVFKASRNRDSGLMRTLRDEIRTPDYHHFVDQRIGFRR